MSSYESAAYEHILTETRGAVGILKLNRPKMLNALSFGVFKEIGGETVFFSGDPEKNESFFGWDHPIYCVEDGRVVEMIRNTELAQNLDKVHAYLGV